MSHWCPGYGARVGEPTYCTAFLFHIYSSWYLGITCRAAVKLDRVSVYSRHTQRSPCSPAVSHSFTRCLCCRTALFRKAKSDPCCMKENCPISDYTLQSMTTKSDELKITITRSLTHISYSGLPTGFLSKACYAPTTTTTWLAVFIHSFLLCF